MKKLFTMISAVVFTSGIFFVIPGMSGAGIDLPWASSFNCSDWAQSMGQDNLQCDGISLSNYAYSLNCGSGPTISEMNGQGNNPLGPGRGFRAAVQDGRNMQAATPAVFFNTPQHEFWVRWYQRWPSTAGLASPGDGLKLLYYELVSQENAGYVAMHDKNMQLYTQAGGTKNASVFTDVGSTAIFGGAFGDDKWHSIEMHFKASSSFAALDGVWEVWVDGIQTGSFTGIDFFADFTHLSFNVNQQITTNPAGMCVFIEYDDFVVQTTGYIGPASATTALSSTN